MINVNAKEERVWLNDNGKGVISGSVLVYGGKDVKGENKPNGFMNVNFSNEVLDKIFDANVWEEEKSQCCITCSFKGFLVHDEYKDIKREKIVVTDISNIKLYVPEEKKEPVKRGRK